MIKLNAEELVVASFDTTVDPQADVNMAPVVTKILCTIDPTSCTACFVCGGE